MMALIYKEERKIIWKWIIYFKKILIKKVSSKFYNYSKFYKELESQFTYVGHLALLDKARHNFTNFQNKIFCIIIKKFTVLKVHLFTIALTWYYLHSLHELQKVFLCALKI
jgi:hypothetical protein